MRPLQGWGWGGVWTEESQPTLEMWREARFQAFYAHNGYLDVLLQVGAVGGALLASIVLITAARLVMLRARPLAVWGVLLLLTLCLSAFSESGPFISAPGLFFIFLLAALTVNGRPRTARSS